MVRSGKTEIAKETFYDAKRPKKNDMLMLITSLSQNYLKQKLILSIRLDI